MIEFFKFISKTTKEKEKRMIEFLKFINETTVNNVVVVPEIREKFIELIEPLGLQLGEKEEDEVYTLDYYSKCITNEDYIHKMEIVHIWLRETDKSKLVTIFNKLSELMRQHDKRLDKLLANLRKEQLETYVLTNMFGNWNINTKEEEKNQ